MEIIEYQVKALSPEIAFEVISQVVRHDSLEGK